MVEPGQPFLESFASHLRDGKETIAPGQVSSIEDTEFTHDSYGKTVGIQGYPFVEGLKNYVSYNTSVLIKNQVEVHLMCNAI